MHPVADPLGTALASLEDALAGKASPGAQANKCLEKVLESVEIAIRRHAAMTGRVEESLSDPDRPLLPSPGIVRRKAGLRKALAGLLRETRTLRTDMETRRATASDTIFLIGARAT